MSDERHDEEEVVDAVVVEEAGGGEVEVEEEVSASTSLVPRAPGKDVLMPMDSAQVVEGMKAYQQLVKDLLDPSDWQDAGSDGKFVKKSGWRKIARAFNLSVTKISSRVERNMNGDPLRAEVVVRALAPNGQVQDGDGYCSADEARFQNARGRAKLENDLRATATTRAKNRAISDLVGMGEVSAEEAEPGGGGGPAMPTLSRSQKKTLEKAITWLLPPAESAATWDVIKGLFGGEIPGPVADAIVAVIGARKKIDEPAAAKADVPPERMSPEKQKKKEAADKKKAEAAKGKQDDDATEPDPPAPDDDAGESEGK